MSNLNKRIDNLMTKLRVDENSVLFAKGETLDEKTIKKISKSKCAKDGVLLNLRNEFLWKGGRKNTLKDKKIVVNTPFIREKSVTQIAEMLRTIDGPMQLIHADFAALNFFSKSAAAPRYVYCA